MNNYNEEFQPLIVSANTTPLNFSTTQTGNYIPLSAVMRRLEKEPKSVTTAPVDFGIIQQGDSKTITIQIKNPNRQTILSSQDKLSTRWINLLSNDTRALSYNDQREIQVKIDTSTLVVGSYTATLIFTAEVNDGEISATVHVPVLLTVSSISNQDNLAKSIIAESPLKTSLSFVQFLSSSQTLPLTIHNWDALNAVNWSADTGSDNNAEFWLTLDRSKGILQPSEQQTIWVTANSNSLQFGDYTATLTLTTGDNQPPIQYQVELAVDAIRDSDNGPKAPITFPDHFDFNKPQSAVTNTKLYITNPLDQSPPYQVILSMDSAAPSWLTWNIDQPEIPLQLGETRTVNLTINKGGLRPGTYNHVLMPTFEFTPADGSHKTSKPDNVALTIA